MRRAHREADVEGSPHLAVRDEDVDAIAELADALIAALEREGAGE